MTDKTYREGGIVLPSKRAGLIFFVCYLAYTSIYIARLNLSVASPMLISRGLIDTVQLGLLGSVFSVIYATGRLFNGQLGDKLRPCLMIAGGLALVGVSNLLLGRLPAYAGVALLWGLNAYGQSMLWSSMLVIMSELYDGDTVKRKTAFLVTAVATGNILGIVVNSLIIKAMGPAAAFIVPGILNLVLCALIMVFTRRFTPERGGEKKRGLLSVFSLLRSKDVRIQLIPAMVDGAVKENITLWMTVFVVDSFKVDLAASAGYVLFIPLIGMLGRAVYSFCFKLCGNDENRLSRYSFLLCALCALPLCLGGSVLLSVLCLSLLYALCSLINTSIISIFPHRFAAEGNIAAVSGLMDFAAYSGAGISAAVYGLVIHSFGYRPMFVSWLFIALLSAWRLRSMSKEK